MGLGSENTNSVIGISFYFFRYTILIALSSYVLIKDKAIKGL